jgi:NADH:ubiquinone oxidoreductase subunit F (NADH-binding)/(2Fe-2S) ferredoxin
MSVLEAMRKTMAKEDSKTTPIISITSGTCGQACGSLGIIDAFLSGLEKLNLKDKVKTKVTGCHGFCAAEPNVIIYPEKIFYVNLKPEDVEEILKETVIGGKVIDRLVYTDKEDKKYPSLDEIPFYKKQLRVVMGDNPLIDATKIEDYVALGGYKALEKAMGKMQPQGVIEIIKKSQLRGRGGAGFPTGFKWDFCRKAKGDVKYIICNADEGDPGAYMDRSLLEGNPHSVIEGMMLGAYAIGACQGWIYVRGEYPLAVKHVSVAIEQARKHGLLGENILDSGFVFDIKIIKGAGAFVCGEETALIQSIESSRGVPRQRPPFPVRKGLWGKPTVINNVETWANVPKIIDKGPDWFAGIGTEACKGTKIFSLVGKIKNTGLVEVPMGITLREIVYDIGGGSQNGQKIKAVQTGGPSGGCIPEGRFDLPVDFQSLTAAGSIMGSGGMIVMDEGTCMVDVAKYFTNFLQDESCGKCVSCREGTQRMHEILSDMTEGKGQEEDIATLLELGNAVKDTSLCGLGQTASNPMLSTLRYFQDEYLAHIRDKKCPAGVCKTLIEYTISPEACTGCGLCRKNCPEDAIAGEAKKVHSINKDKCIKCGICREVCKFDAVIVN